jgi:hypothetical protein
MSAEQLKLEGWNYNCIVTPYIDRAKRLCLWYNGVGGIVDVTGCLLQPRSVDSDGTCYLFRRPCEPPLETPDTEAGQINEEVCYCGMPINEHTEGNSNHDPRAINETFRLSPDMAAPTLSSETQNQVPEARQ